MKVIGNFEKKKDQKKNQSTVHVRRWIVVYLL